MCTQLSHSLSCPIPPFLQPQEIYVDDESKLTLHGLVQHYIMLHEEEKNRKLTDLLDALDFNQVVIFVKSVQRANELNKLLNECNFPSVCIHRGMNQVFGKCMKLVLRFLMDPYLWVLDLHSLSLNVMVIFTLLKNNNFLMF
jgi:hypothetical protein